MPHWTVWVVAGVVASAFALPAEAQWKWRDASGRTQYSDLPPPPGVAEKDILSRPALSRPVAPVAASAASTPASAGLSVKGAEPELEAKRKLAEQAEADKRKAEEAKQAAVRADNCQRAREQIRTLDSGIRIARVNPQGEREVLDDAARAEEARRARQTASADCR